MKLHYLILFVICGFWAQNCQAQMAGSPIDTRGSGEWTISAQGSYSTILLSNKMETEKFLLKSAWGVTSWLDAYIVGGVTRLGLQYSDFTDYKDKFRPAYGLGLTVSLTPPDSKGSIGIWIGGQLLRFASKSSIEKALFASVEEHHMEYDQREFQFYGGIKIPVQKIHFYLAGVGWTMSRDEKLKVYQVTENDRLIQYKENGVYGSDLLTGGIIGIQFDLPDKYAVSIEGLFFNEDNYQITIGICQTGQQ